MYFVCMRCVLCGELRRTLPSPIYNYVISLVVSLSFCWGLCALQELVFFNVAKFAVLTPLSLLSFCRLSFPTVFLKISSLPTFALKSNRIFFWYLGKWSKPALIPHKSYLLVITFLLNLCMYITNNDITPATSQNYMWHPITNRPYSLNCC
jgi:hypothetical protein